MDIHWGCKNEGEGKTEREQEMMKEQDGARKIG